MAYDQNAGVHVLFGGEGDSTYSDTFTFNTATMSWTLRAQGPTDLARSAAAATYVPPLNGIVMFGGVAPDYSTRSDMYYWTGSNWTAIGYTNPSEAPSLWNHSIAWNGSALIVTGGFLDSANSPNPSTWTVTFTETGSDGAWEATWTDDANSACRNNAKSAADPNIYPRAAMAYDAAAGWKVFFGGLSGSVTEGNTVECR